MLQLLKLMDNLDYKFLNYAVNLKIYDDDFLDIWKEACCSYKLLKLLMETGNINIQIIDEHYKINSLYLVINNNTLIKKLEMVKLLVCTGLCNFSHIDSYGNSLLIISLKKKEYDIARFLINTKKIDLSIINNNGETCFNIILGDEFIPNDIKKIIYVKKLDDID